MASRHSPNPSSGGKGTRAERRAASRQDARSRQAPRSALEPAIPRLGRRWLLPAVLVVAAVAAGGIIVAGLTAPPAPVANVARPVEGSATAPVTVAEYSDYQCDYCGRWAREVEATFRSTYVATGQVRFEWHDDAWEGQESIDAANAARCAGDQGKFWEMHDLLYTSQNATPNTGAFSKDRLKSLGASLGIATTTYNACVDSGTYNAAVRSDTAMSSGAFSGTPAFTVNGTPLVGYQTMDELTAAITKAAAGPSAAASGSTSAAATVP